MFTEARAQRSRSVLSDIALFDGRRVARLLLEGRVELPRDGKVVGMRKVRRIAQNELVATVPEHLQISFVDFEDVSFGCGENHTDRSLGEGLC